VNADPARRPRRRLLALEGILLVGLLGFWLASRQEPAPRVSWQFGDTRTAQEPFAELPADFPVRLTVELDSPRHVYVASWDMLRGNIALWPSTRLKSVLTTNPLAAGTHALPGRYEQQDIVWHVGDGVGVTTFFVIASKQPLPDLASAMQRFRQMGNAAFPGRHQCATYAPNEGMAAVPPRNAIAHELLKLCSEQAGLEHDGEMVAVPGRPGVWMKAMRVVTPLPEEPLSVEEARKELQGRLGPLDGVMPGVVDPTKPAPTTTDPPAIGPAPAPGTGR
jgi:hypothetical protein